MNNRIHVIGLAVQQDISLSGVAQSALESSAVIIGSERQLEILSQQAPNLPTAEKSLMLLPKLSELKTMIDSEMESLENREGYPSDISILASGDPMYFGIGRWLARQFDRSCLNIIPSVSSIQAVCSELGLALQDCDVISLHGRDLSNLSRALKQNRTLILLTDHKSNPHAIAKFCVQAGFSDASITVCEDLGTEAQIYRQYPVIELDEDLSRNEEVQFSDLLVCVVVTGKARSAIEFPGIPDREFVTDGAPGQGMFTKREVRLVITSLLQPASKDVIWDIGAGCGGVSTELCYWNSQLTVYAIEQNETRLQCLRENRLCRGVTNNLKVISGRAPEVLSELPRANKIFIGGNDGELGDLLKDCWKQLPEDGCLVASAVTQKTLEILTDFAITTFDNENRDCVESLQIAVSKSEWTNGRVEYIPKLPVTVFKFVKPESDNPTGTLR